MSSRKSDVKFPLGGNIFASVFGKKRRPFVFVRHYVPSSLGSHKTQRLHPSHKGVVLSLDQLHQFILNVPLILRAFDSLPSENASDSNTGSRGQTFEDENVDIIKISSQQKQRDEEDITRDEGEVGEVKRRRKSLRPRPIQRKSHCVVCDHGELHV